MRSAGFQTSKFRQKEAGALITELAGSLLDFLYWVLLSMFFPCKLYCKGSRAGVNYIKHASEPTPDAYSPLLASKPHDDGLTENGWSVFCYIAPMHAARAEILDKRDAGLLVGVL